MEYKGKIVYGKEVIYKNVRFYKEENDNFIKVNGDIINPIHYDEKTAHTFLEKIGLGNLEGIIVAGELIKQKILFAPEIEGLPYIVKIGFHHPLVMKDETYVDFILERIAAEPGSYHHKFKVQKDGYAKPIIVGEVVSISELLWSLDGKVPKPLAEPIMTIDNIKIEDNINEKFHNSIKENYTKEKSVMIASSFIPPQMLNVIKDVVSKEFGEDERRQYVFNSQEMTIYRKKTDLAAPLSFHFSQPKLRKGANGIMCSTTLHAINNNERILECRILGAII